MSSLPPNERDAIRNLIREEITAANMASMTLFDASANSRPPRNENSSAPEPPASFTPLQGGDLISLRVCTDGFNGWIMGSTADHNVCVEAEVRGTLELSLEQKAGFLGHAGARSSSSQPASSPRRFDDCVFRICPKLNYRALSELKKIKNMGQSSSMKPSITEKRATSKSLEQVQSRAENESTQNAEAMSLLRRGQGTSIKYGDVVQLEHLKSELFVTLHKTPAAVNLHCRKVSLLPGSHAAHFRVLPRFKVRSIGSLVYANDEIVFQSVKFDPLMLGASCTSRDMLFPHSTAANDPLAHHPGVRLPSCLRHAPQYEVSGSAALRSFHVELYFRCSTVEAAGGGGSSDSSGGSGKSGPPSKVPLLTGLHLFRLYHPERGDFVSASGDADKGQVLDARDPAKQSRCRPLLARRFLDGRGREGGGRGGGAGGGGGVLLSSRSGAYASSELDSSRSSSSTTGGGGLTAGALLPGDLSTAAALSSSRFAPSGFSLLPVPAHVPYLKRSAKSGDHLSNPANFSAKAVWRFETLDRTTCKAVEWRTMPLRLRHVASDKYLSVDSLHPTATATATATTVSTSATSATPPAPGATASSPPLSAAASSSSQQQQQQQRRQQRHGGLGTLDTSAAVGDGGSAGPSRRNSDGEGGGGGGSSVSGATKVFNAALVLDADESVDEGAFGSPSSLVFYLVPTDVTSHTVQKGVSTVRLEHRSASGETLHLMAPLECKPPLTRLEDTNDDPDPADPEADPDSDAPPTVAAPPLPPASALGAGGGKPKGGRILFSTAPSSVDVLQIVPVTSLEAKQLQAVCSRVHTLRLYAHVYQTFGFASAQQHSSPQMEQGGGKQQGRNLSTSARAKATEESGTLDVSSTSSTATTRAGQQQQQRACLPPTELCEAVVEQCLALVKDLSKGAAPPRRHAKVADAMKEANAMIPTAFSALFSLEPDPRMQNFAREVKLVDAVFEAALAPYNRALHAGGQSPFAHPPASDQPKAAAKFLYVALQRALARNPVSQEYFAQKSSRVWLLPSSSSSSSSSSSVADGGGGGAADGGGSGVSASSSSSSAPPPPPLFSQARREWSHWSDIVVSQGEDSLGATVTLTQLLSSSETTVKKLLSPKLFATFKGLIQKCGPEPRLINLFASICTVAGKPSRANQEMCLRTLWMNLPDRYAFGLTFHERPRSVSVGAGELPSPVRKRVPHPDKAPRDYLGKTDANEWGSVCVAWKGADEWAGGSGNFFWSAHYLDFPVVGTVDPVAEERTPFSPPPLPVQPPQPLGEKAGKAAMKSSGPAATSAMGVLPLVPLEQLLWVLEPERLCEGVTGAPWTPLHDFRSGRRSQHALRRMSVQRQHNSGVPGSSQSSSGSSDPRRSTISFDGSGNGSSGGQGHLEELRHVERAATFQKQLQLADYAVAQVKLLAHMCKGRSYNCIAWLEKSFSYDCLLNMASNPLLPFVFRSAVLDFTQALYVDRFPQLVHAGAPRLPDLLWVFHEDQDENDDEGKRDHMGVGRKSATSVVQPLTLQSEAAFPAFAVPSLSRVASDPNPVLSFPSHFKFFLLRTLCNSIVASSSSSGQEPGRMVYSAGALNEFVGAALRGQQGLLDFGFQSTHVKLKDLCEVNAKLLDGRSDLEKPGAAFDPPEKRYRWSGVGGAVTKVKREIVQLFLDVADLRSHYRLAKLLHLFKKAHAEAESGSSSGRGFLEGRTAADQRKLYHEFEAMFPGGSDDAAQLDLAVLCDKPDLDHVLVDCLMYDDDELLEAALHLLSTTYGQRAHLRQALCDATLLPTMALPVFGDVHALRSCLTDLLFQVRTSSSWGVKSRVSGPFDDGTFAALMSNVEKLLVFLHSPETVLEPPPSSPSSEEDENARLRGDGAVRGSRSWMGQRGRGAGGRSPSSSFPSLSPARRKAEEAPPPSKSRLAERKEQQQLAKKSGESIEMASLLSSSGPPLGTGLDGSINVVASSGMSPGSGGGGGGKSAGDDRPNYQGYFKETDLQGNTYESKNLWSLDVAAKWSVGPSASARKATSGGSCQTGGGQGSKSSSSSTGNTAFASSPPLGECSSHHQLVLRACGLQDVLVEALAMDHEMAWKGSICTEREKVESERRLTLVKKALIQLATAFVSGNPANQEVMFGHLRTLRALATPPELQPRESSGSHGFDSRAGNTQASTKSGGSLGRGGNGGGGTPRATGSTHATPGGAVGSKPPLGSRFSRGSGSSPRASSSSPRLSPPPQKRSGTPGSRSSSSSTSGTVGAVGGAVRGAGNRAATPPFFDSDFPSSDQKESKAEEEVGAELSSAWPSTVPEFAQELIIQTLARNPTLCSKVKSSSPLPELFASLVDRSADCSRAPALEFFFVLIQPQGAGTLPSRDAQAAVAEILLSPGSFPRLAAAVKRAVLSQPGTANPGSTITGTANSSNVGGNGIDLGNPARLVRLVATVLENKNESAASQLMQGAGLSIDAACASLSALVALKTAGGQLQQKQQEQHQHQQQQPPRRAVEGMGRSGSRVARAEARGASPPARASSLGPFGEGGSGEGGGDVAKEVLCSELGSSLLNLLVSQVLLLPMNTAQLLSEPLWRFLDTAAAPALKALSFAQQQNSGARISRPELACCEDLLDVLHYTFAMLQRLGLFESVFQEDALKAGVVADVVIDVKALLDSRPLSPDHVRHAFMAAAMRKGLAAAEEQGGRSGDSAPKAGGAQASPGLDRNAFVQLLKDLGGDSSLPFTGDDDDDEVKSEQGFSGDSAAPSDGVRGYETAFEVADVDGKGVVDLFQFLAYYEASQSSVINGGGARPFANSTFSLRAVECAERICAMGRGEHLARPPQFTREDSLKSGDSQPASAVAASLGREGGDSGKGREQGGGGNDSRLSDRFRCFKSTVMRNPRIVSALQRRRFSMLLVLEQGVPPPPPSSLQRRKSLSSSLKDTGASSSSDPAESPLCSAIALDWSDVTKRFVRYCSEHLYDGDEDGGGSGSGKSGEHQGSSGKGARTAKLILEMWRVHLVKARTLALEEDGRTPAPSVAHASVLKQVKPHELSEDSRASFRAKQRALNSLGVTELLTKIVCSVEDVRSGGLPDLALGVLAEVLNSGASEVAHSLYDFLVRVDPQGKFVQHLGRRLDTGLSLLRAAKALSAFGGGGGEGGEDASGKESSARGAPSSPHVYESAGGAAACEYVALTARVLQLLCEGHNAKLQDFVRFQPAYATPCNLVAKLVEVLVLLCDSSVAVSALRQGEVQVVSQLLSSLTEAMQGPCPGNQEEVVSSEALVAVNNLVQAVNSLDQDKSAADPRHMEIRGQACILLAACLEGREDFDCHEPMAKKLEVGALGDYQALVEGEICLIRARAFGRAYLGPETQRLATLQAALVAVVTVQMELREGRRVELKKAHAQAVEDEEQSGSNGRNRSSSGSGGDGDDDGFVNGSSRGEVGRVGDSSVAFGRGDGRSGSSSEIRRELEKISSQELVGVVEVAWKGQIERNIFPLPLEVEHLSSETKERFLESVDLATTEKRMSELIEQSERFIAEMQLVHSKAQVSALFRFLRRHMPKFKKYLYLAVLLVNLDMVLSPTHMVPPGRAAEKVFSGALVLTPVEAASLAFSIVLFCVVLAGYGVIIGHVGSTEVPMVIRELEAEWAEGNDVAGKSDNGDGGGGEGENTWADNSAPASPPPPPAWNVRPLASFAALCGLALVFLAMHVMNFAPVPGWYLTVALLLFPVLTWSLRCAIVRPSTPLQRKFCIGFDVLVTRSFFRNHVLLALCSVLGMYNMEFFTLQLLDVVNISPIIADIIKSTTKPAMPLLSTLYLFAVTSVIYASFGMAYFPHQLQVPYEIASTDDDGGDDDATRRLFGASEWEAEHDGGGMWGESSLFGKGEDESSPADLVGRLLAVKKSSGSSESTTTSKKTCTSLYECTLFLFYSGMSEQGNMKSILRVASPGQYSYIPRIIFDSVYFIWVGVVLVNIITGLMVDTFSELREDKSFREHFFDSECFVCGLARHEYENLGLASGSASFDEHMRKDHDLWNYVYFLAYLQHKEPTEYNGIESFVASELAKGSLDWVPTRMSFAIQDQGKGPGSAEDAATEASVAALEDKLNSVLQHLAQLTALQNQASSARGQQQKQSIP